MKKELTFYFIRHGRTEWNEQGLMQGWGNSNLTETGVLAAQATGQALQNVPFVAAYSSGLQRTIDTARHILGARKIPLFQHIGLNEHYFGRWEGMKANDIRQLDEFQQMINDPANYKALSNGGETWAQLAERTMGAIQDIIQIHSKGNILIVSHGHSIRLLMALFAGATWQNHRDKKYSPSILNTAINIVRYVETENGNGQFTVEKINDTTHLN